MAMRGAFMVLALTIAALPRGACAQDDPGQSDPACAKYQEPLAYNACLASHGPKANAIGVGARQTQSAGAAPRSSARPSRSAPDREWPAATRRRGRVHMEFRVQ